MVSLYCQLLLGYLALALPSVALRLPHDRRPTDADELLSAFDVHCRRPSAFDGLWRRHIGCCGLVHLSLYDTALYTVSCLACALSLDSKHYGVLR